MSWRARGGGGDRPGWVAWVGGWWWVGGWVEKIFDVPLTLALKRAASLSWGGVVILVVVWFGLACAVLCVLCVLCGGWVGGWVGG